MCRYGKKQFFVGVDILRGNKKATGTPIGTTNYDNILYIMF
jgi:hypothetical protein